MKSRCAIVGIGQTHHAAARLDVSLGGLVREAAQRALTDAELEWGDIEAVVLGKAPDVLEGMMSPELYLADSLGAAGKPVFRAYTSGNAGGMAASMGVNLIAAGAALPCPRGQLREAVGGGVGRCDVAAPSL